MVSGRIVQSAKISAGCSSHRFRVGAVVYRKNKIVSWGYNQATKTHPRSPHPFRSIHAEFDAVLDAVKSHGRNLSDYSIYVHRLKKDGSDGLAKPCEWCQKMLTQVGINQIYYSQG